VQGIGLQNAKGYQGTSVTTVENLNIGQGNARRRRKIGIRITTRGRGMGMGKLGNS
jgi:hypothetical protein